MAEVIGTIASVITLAALFKSCVDAFEIIKTAHNQEYDLRKLVLKLNLERCRLYTWGEAMGLTDGAKEQPPSARCQFHDVMTETLQMLLHLFEDSERLSKVYGCKEFLDITGHEENSTAEVKRLAASFSNFGSKRARWRQKGTRVFNQAKWAVHDRQKFQCFISDIKDYIDGLQNMTATVAPPITQECRVQARIMTVDDVETLDMISETCQKDYPEISKAASDRADSLSTVTTGRWKIEHWEYTDTRLVTDAAVDIEALDVTELKHHVYRMLKEQQELKTRLNRVQALLTDSESALSRSVDDIGLNMPLTRRSILELRMPFAELGVQPMPMWMETRQPFPKLAPTPWHAESSLRLAALALNKGDTTLNLGQDHPIDTVGSEAGEELAVTDAGKDDDDRSDSSAAGVIELEYQSELNRHDDAFLNPESTGDSSQDSSIPVEWPVTNRDIQRNRVGQRFSTEIVEDGDTSKDDICVNDTSEDATSGTRKHEHLDPHTVWSGISNEHTSAAEVEESSMNSLIGGNSKESLLKTWINFFQPRPSEERNLVNGFQNFAALSDADALSPSRQDEYFTLSFNISGKSMHPQLTPCQGHTHFLCARHVAKIVRLIRPGAFDIQTWPRCLAITTLLDGHTLDRAWAKILVQSGLQFNVFAAPVTSPMTCSVPEGGCMRVLFDVLAANRMYARCDPEIWMADGSIPFVYLVPLGKSIAIPSFVVNIHPNFQPSMDMFLVIVFRLERRAAY